jgi:hypothetical protein
MMEEELCAGGLLPAETDLFSYESREVVDGAHVYHACVLRAPMGPLRAGAAAARIAVRLEDGTIRVDTDAIVFFGYVRLHVA